VAAGPGENRRAARAHGQRVHELLQAAVEGGRLPPGAGEAREEAAAVLANRRLAWVFRPEDRRTRGLCEVPLIHRLPAAAGEPERRLIGRIDRLLIGPDHIDVVDYKTDRATGPAALDRLCERHRAQLAAYGAALAAIHPDREIRLWLLFTGLVDGDGQGVLRRVE
jgi:ATP-dependent helicase/nuclease subunit A